MNETEVFELITNAMTEARSIERPHGFEMDLIASRYTRAVVKALNGVSDDQS